MNKIQIIFDPVKHTYTDNLGRKYVSVTTLIKPSEPFDSNAIAERVINQPNSKYYKMKKEDVVAIWSKSAPLGQELHSAIEQYTKNKTITENVQIQPLIKQFSRLKFTGKLYSEKIVFDEDYLIAGSVDLLEDIGDEFWLYDIKTCVGNRKQELSPDRKDHFTLQLNIYKRLVEKCLEKPCNIGGIIWFADYAEKQKDTKLQFVRIHEQKSAIDLIFRKRKLELENRLAKN